MRTAGHVTLMVLTLPNMNTWCEVLIMCLKLRNTRIVLQSSEESFIKWCYFDEIWLIYLILVSK